MKIPEMKFWLGLPVILGFCLFMTAPSGAAAASWENDVPRYTEARVSVKRDGPKLLFSDSPENVTDCGVMYRDTVQGPVRLFFHHVNETSVNRRLAVVLRRTTARAVKVTQKETGISRPRRDWLLAGKEAQERYYRPDQKPDSFRLTKLVDLLEDKGKPTVVRPGDLVTGIVDLDFDRPVEVSVMMLPVKTDLSLAMDAYGILPPDHDGEHILRGTFEAADRHVTLDQPFHTSGHAIWGIKLADDDLDPYARGVDATTGQPVVNYGNYGILYDLTLPTQGRHDTVIRFNPMGGTYAGAGILSISGKADQQLRIPAGRTAFGDVGYDWVTEVIGEIPANQTAVLHFSPPGSSNLPVRIFLEIK